MTDVPWNFYASAPANVGGGPGGQTPYVAPLLPSVDIITVYFGQNQKYDIAELLSAINNGWRIVWCVATADTMQLVYTLVKP